MRECDNSKIHISSNVLLSTCLIIMLDTLLVPSLHCNTSPHFTKLHFTTFIDTSLPLIYTSLPYLGPYLDWFLRLNVSHFESFEDNQHCSFPRTQPGFISLTYIENYHLQTGFYELMLDFWLPPRSRWDPSSSGI